MRTTSILLSSLLTLAVYGCGGGEVTEPVASVSSETTVVPVFVPDNPSCESLGLGTFSYKVEPPDSGTYPLDAFNDVTVTVDNLTFDWSADLSIDAVIVKGGPNSNLYVYDPEALAGYGLHAPVNPENGEYYGLSHIEFCFDYNVAVAKTAVPSFDRSYSWTIDKGSAVTELTLSAGQIINVDYWVDLAATFEDDNFAVGGAVTVTNPAPIAATITGISDMLGATSVTLVCPVTFPYSLASQGTLVCTYLVPVASAATVTNEVTVETTGLVGGGSASDVADFASEAVMTEIDECLTVSDDHFGSLGTFCEPGPHHLTYTLALGPYECGEYGFTNVASFVTNDTGATGSDSWAIPITVPCPTGCTLTPGYWKTHSSYGPAPYDDAWALLSGGADAMFFLSGQSYYEVLWTAPVGNAYYVLAHAYIAAKLNMLNGADPAAAQPAFADATAIFAAWTPSAAAALKGKVGTVLRAQMLMLATTLDNYNNGLIGPGHCDE